MVLAARARAEHEGLAGLVTYQQGDARHLSLDRPVDVVVSDGALAFVEGHREALAQWIDVVVPHGFLADAEFYYRDPPPDALLRELSDAIDVQVQPYERAYWDELFTHDLLEPYYVHRSSAVARTVSEIEAYCRRLVAHVRPFWRPSAEAALLERLQALFTLFNRNLAHMDYVVHVHSRLPADAEPALFV